MRGQVSSNPVFNELRLKRQLCDAVISVDGEEFPIHKIILSCCSQYFRSCFSWNLHKKDEVYKLHEFSPDIIGLIIEFAYTGNVEVTEDNAQSLYMAAEYFDFPSLTEACTAFMEQRLCIENCIQIWQFTGFYSCPRLHHSAYLFIACHFTEVCTSPEFLELSVEELSQIIEDDKLDVKEESIVFEAVLRWINHSTQERSRYISLFLPKVRLALMTSDYFKNNVENNELVKWNNKLKDTLKQADTLINGTITFTHGTNHHLARPRIPAGILLAIGGWLNSGMNDTIDAYDTYTDLWVTLVKNEVAGLVHHGSAFLEGAVYCVGGSTGDGTSKGVHRFDLDTRTWNEVASMNSCRCFVSITVLKGRIFAIGGYDGQARLNTAECYDPKTNQWTDIASMHEKRSDAGCTTLGGNVYICGGYNGTQCLSSVERYSPETNSWTTVTSMSSRRSGLGVITFEDRIYAVGGFNGNRINTVEAYNPITRCWSEERSMPMPRNNFGIEVVDDSIFVIGGYNDSGLTSKVEFYNRKTDVWSETTRLKVPCSSMSCCVVYGLNMADYKLLLPSRNIVV
ncbi:kelch-like protein 10 [Genypterus blacodes]|uniref:kelch-like protein 10 n=1 Tax=Genypterus blacodes TaxID=154954 RepID=UPI003F770346